MKDDVGSDPLLRLLRHHYGERWSIRRTARLWIATTMDDTARHAPTLIEEDLETFIRQLENPPAGAGRATARQGPRERTRPRNGTTENGPLEG
ncbi:hypothetical protein J0910_02310 [Nocardiopsis sp. CNT-189]|uniref:hypothetical protein n=1 Tax=Nocardiopsis oceanisediminis TaxID=2816862 RepID=UPI003B296B5F